MKDDLKAKYLFDLQASELFTAQIALENELIESLQSKFLAIDGKSNVEFEYARVRGSLEALKGLKSQTRTSY
jgi:hypothetical protein